MLGSRSESTCYMVFLTSEESDAPLAIIFAFILREPCGLFPVFLFFFFHLSILGRRRLGTVVPRAGAR
jgi:hypothetical protein